MSKQRITYCQRSVLFKFMKANPDLASGRLNGLEGSRRKKTLLKQLSILLNAQGDGASKTPDKWYKSWKDWKSDLKAKARKIKTYSRGTGGGPAATPLTPLEDEMLDFIGHVAVDGLEVPDSLEIQRKVEAPRLASNLKSRSPIFALAHPRAPSMPRRCSMPEELPCTSWSKEAPRMHRQYEEVPRQQQQHEETEDSPRTPRFEPRATEYDYSQNSRQSRDPLVAAMQRQAAAAEKMAAAAETQLSRIATAFERIADGVPAMIRALEAVAQAVTHTSDG